MYEAEPSNEERTCREGHTYVTSAGEPGLCWCGARAELKLAEPHDHDNPLIVEYRDYTIEARRSESLGGDDNIYYSIIRKSDGYFVVDNFTSDETPVAKFAETVLKPMIDDIIQNPLDYYDSEEDYREGLEPPSGGSPETSP